MAIQVNSINGMGSVTEPSPGTFSTSGMSDADHMALANNFVARAGVLDNVNDFKVTQRGAGANMSVDVAAGTAYVLNASWTTDSTTNTKYWSVNNDATINAVIGSNSSGNPRIDAVCLKIDTAAVPDADAANVASIAVTAGTPAATPSAPATPSNQLLLAYVAVANGAVSIVTADITDKRVSSQLDIGDGFNAGMFRQAIMNGNFEIWERLKYSSFSTTISDVTTTYGADRWHDHCDKNGGTLPTLTRSRQSHTAGDVLGSFYYTRLNTNGAGTSLGNSSYHRYAQNIEYGTRYLCGLNKKVTVTFYAKSSIANKRIGVYLVQNYGTGGSPTSDETITGSIVTLTSSWVKYTWTFTTNTIVGKTFGTANNDYLSVRIMHQWGATTGATYFGTGTTAETYVGSGNIEISQVQVNSGDTALPFEPYEYNTELRKCQRFCYVPDTSAAGISLGHGAAYSTTAVAATMRLPVRMRTTPAFSPAITAADWDMSNSSASAACSTLVIGAQSGTDTILLIGTAAAPSFTAGDGFYIGVDATPNRIMVLSAEL